MRPNDIPAAQRERAFIHGLYQAIGLQPHPLRAIWDLKFNRQQRRDLADLAMVPRTLTLNYGRFDDLPKGWRDQLMAAWDKRQQAAA